MEFLLSVLSGLTLGTLHAFDADHIAAVSAFSSKNPDARKAARLGIVWGIGHSVTLMIFGLLAVAFRFVIPPLLESIAESAVGVVLIVIGLWVLRDMFKRKKIHIHTHQHDGVEHSHFHSHTTDEGHRHQHSVFFVGAAHGLAGTASVLVLIPLALSQSVLTAASYLLLFGVGTTCSMGLFAYLIGSISRAARVRSILPFVQGAAGIASLGIGIAWIGKSLLV